MEVKKEQGVQWAAASHEDPRKPGVFRKILAFKESFKRGQVQMLNWARLPVGSSFHRHYHEDMQEVFMIASGVCEMETPQGKQQLGAGDAVLIDPREVHQMRNIGKEDVFYFVFGITSEQGGKTVMVE